MSLPRAHESSAAPDMADGGVGLGGSELGAAAPAVAAEELQSQDGQSVGAALRRLLGHPEP